MAGTMLPPESRPHFLELAARTRPPEDFANRFEQLFGWKPPLEILDYETVRFAYAAHMPEIAEPWVFIASDDQDEEEGDDAPIAELGDDVDFPVEYFPPSAAWLLRGKDPDETLDRLLASEAGTMFLLTGLMQLGSDPAGDSCWGSLLPHPRNAVEVFPYDHEVGELQDDVHYSFAHFVVSYWDGLTDADEDDDDGYEDDGFDSDEDEEDAGDTESDDGERFVARPLLNAFEKEAKKLQKARPNALRPYELFQRSQWLLGHCHDQPTYAFAGHMERAAAFSAWKKEKAQLATHPHLIYYWIIAHYFLQNDAACREACQLALKLPGELTRALARRMLSQLDSGEPVAFKTIPSAARLQQLRGTTLKNAAAGLLDGDARTRLAAMSADTGALKLAKAACEARLQAGEDPFALIAAYPDDVETHDLCLAKAAANDPKFKKIVTDYMRERKDAHYNVWPYNANDLDRRLSLPCAAAFRSGLRYDAEHKKAFCGITKTLGMFDDDAAMKAFAEAIERLEQDDDRFEAIIQSLNRSTHVEAPALLRAGAWRFLNNKDAAIEKQKRIDAQGPTLDAMVMQNSRLRPALYSALRFEDEVSEKLADAVLAHSENPQIMGVAIGDALRVLRRRGLDRHVDFAATYLQRVADVAGQAEFFEFRILYNGAEAAMTLAARRPQEALTFLKKAFDEAQGLPHIGSRLDLIACLVSGLLVLEPEEPVWWQWVERILGNRSGEPRVYGPLAALSEVCRPRRIEAGPQILASVRHHVYADPTPILADPTPVYIETAARSAWTGLTGTPLPAFSDEDKYALRLKGDDIPAAITHPERYGIEHVFKRVTEEGLRHPDVARLGGAWLLDSLRYGSDEVQYNDGSDRRHCLKALVLQGEEATASLAACLELPHTRQELFPDLFAALRICVSEARMRVLYAGLSQEELLLRLHRPTETDLPFLDVLASSALALAGDAAVDSAMAALRFRMRFLDRDAYQSAEMDLMLGSLPRVIAAAGEAGRKGIESFRAEIEQNEGAASLLEEALAMPTPSARPLAPAPGSTLELVLPPPPWAADVQRTFRLQALLSGGQLECETIGYDPGGSLTAGEDLSSRAEWPNEVSVDRLIGAALLEGFAPPETKAKKKRA